MKVLTARQHQIAELLASGLTQEQVAARLGLSQSTVKRHSQDIYNKLGIHRIAELVQFLKTGLRPAQDAPPKLLLSIEEAAMALGITQSALYNLTRTRSRNKTGKPIPFVRLGKKLGFRLESLKAWIEASESK
jgi:excisionase family DNA binding protein